MRGGAAWAPRSEQHNVSHVAETGSVPEEGERKKCAS